MNDVLNNNTHFPIYCGERVEHGATMRPTQMYAQEMKLRADDIKSYLLEFPCHCHKTTAKNIICILK